jgi:glycine/D-amino acid oxidase-like deaminating enzyme
VVVGGGIVGLSTAWWRQREGGGRVVLLEAGALAGRASGRNAGFLITGTPQPLARLIAERGREAALALWHRSRENRELLRAELLEGDLHHGVHVDCDFLPEGSWTVALAGTGQEEELAASHELLREEGFEVEWHDAAAVRAASGGSDGSALGGGLFQPRDGGLDPVLLCRGLAATGGFSVETGARVLGLEPAPGGRVRVLAEGGDWLAERVVVATNAHAPELLPHLVPEVRPVRAQMLATDPGERRLAGVWYVDAGGEYLRQLADGTLLVGGARRTAEAAEVGYLEAPTGQVQGALDAFLARTFPHLAGRPVRHRWAGTMAFTPDGLPRIGEAPDLPGVLYAAGWNGHGMSLGFVAGRHLGRLALDHGEAPLF